MGIFPLRCPTLIRYPPPSSLSLRVLIPAARPKPGEQLRGSDSHITHPGQSTDINNQLFPSSLFRNNKAIHQIPNNTLPAALCPGGPPPLAFRPYKVIQPVARGGMSL